MNDPIAKCHRGTPGCQDLGIDLSHDCVERAQTSEPHVDVTFTEGEMPREDVSFRALIGTDPPVRLATPEEIALAEKYLPPQVCAVVHVAKPKPVARVEPDGLQVALRDGLIRGALMGMALKAIVKRTTRRF